MVHVINDDARPAFTTAITAMHRLRKDVFVDRLGWALVVTDDRLEVDQFDHDGAIYLIDQDDPRGPQYGSLRLLPSTGPHLLDTVFPMLCADDIPRGPTIYEITRLCLSPYIPAHERRQVLNRLVIALVEYGLLHGIEHYTCLCEMSFVSQIIAMGWNYQPLGLPQTINGQLLMALQLHVTPATLRLFRDQWQCRRPVISLPAPSQAA